MAAAWVTSANQHGPLPIPGPSLMGRGSLRSAPGSASPQSGPLAELQRMPEVRGAPQAVVTQFSVALSWTGEWCHPLPPAPPLAAPCSPRLPRSARLAPWPGLHLLQTLETSLHLNKGLLLGI